MVELVAVHFHLPLALGVVVVVEPGAVDQSQLLTRDPLVNELAIDGLVLLILSF